MKELDLLPPSSNGQLTALALVAVVGSLLFCITLFYLKWTYPAMMYAFFVAIGFLMATRGGMHYQGDIDSFLSKHPELSSTELPWPAGYQQLSRKQKFLYTTRGLSQTIANGFLLPVNALLIALTAIGVLNGEAAEKLFYRHDKPNNRVH